MNVRVDTSSVANNKAEVSQAIQSQEIQQKANYQMYLYVCVCCTIINIVGLRKR